jgi:putative effector of murein hydrolase
MVYPEEVSMMLATLGWSLLVLGVFTLARWVFNWTKISLLHPVFTSTLVLMAIVEFCGRHYASFQASTQWLVWLLGPSVVSFAVPVYRLRQLIVSHWQLLLITIPFSVLFGFFSMWLTLHLLHAPREVTEALSLKSITAPITLEIAQDRHANLPLAAIGTMFASVMGACLGPTLLHLFRVKNNHAVGLALGCASHGVGTSRAYELGPIEGAYASMGMICSGICGAILCPAILNWLS